MKVFNKEVEECCMCPCLDHLDMDGSPYCNMLQKDIKDSNTIDKDCPFNKSVTKEDFEKFGFKYESNESGEEQPNLHDLHGYSSAYAIDNQLSESKTVFLLYHFPDNFVIIDSIVDCSSDREHMLFRGIINNPIELEFILQSTGIIENK